MWGYGTSAQIRMFPSREFYNETLEDGPNVKDDNMRPWHEHPVFGPFAWLDVRGTEYVKTESFAINA